MSSESAHVSVISRSLIKPSSPTPEHLRHLQLSFLDQSALPIYIPVAFLYEADEVNSLTINTDHVRLSETLKDSLSTTLTSFYPLAGRLNMDGFTVTCNDMGVEFVEARVHSSLAYLLNNPTSTQDEIYFPLNPHDGLSAGEGKVFLAQINYFECGGIAVGACMLHYVGDGWSMIEFMNSWAATCRGEKWNNNNNNTSCMFGSIGKAFPTRDLPDLKIMEEGFARTRSNMLVTRRFVFDKDQLVAVKVAATGEDDLVENPSRVEALTAFIWQNTIENSLAEGKKRFAATHAVNIRPKAGESLQLQHAFGNAVVITAAFNQQSHVESGINKPPHLSDLVIELRNSIRKIDEEYIKENRYLNELSKFHDMRGDIEEISMFTSWSRFPIYKVDFGWGIPVGHHLIVFNNYAMFVPTRDGEGIEVWTKFTRQQGETLDKKIKLLKK